LAICSSICIDDSTRLYDLRHFHSRGLSWKNLYLGAPDVAVARDQIFFNLGEHTGNIWMTRLAPR
jgi:hypothetical protein